MDILEYISSGILESYALGMCNEMESREVEAMLAQHPELRIELESIENTLNAYATLHSKTPGTDLRQRILAELDDLRIQTPLKVVYKAETPVMKSPDMRYRFAVAASVTLFFLSFIGNIIIYNKYKSASDELVALSSEKQLLTDNFKANQARYEMMQSEMAVLSSPDVSKVMLKGVEKSPESMAMVYWNKKSKEVFLEVKALPQPAPGKQYQLWAIVDGKPVDAGMLTAGGDSTLHKMKDFESAQAFAITLENQGGSPVPSMSEMYVMGAVSL